MKKIQALLILFVFSISCEKDPSADDINKQALIEVSVFLSETCPIAQYMTLPLNNAYEAFASDSVVFRGYFPNLLSNTTSIVNFVEKYSIPFDCIDDNNGEMVSLLGATVYSEVFIKYNNNLVYRGMIDDSYTDLGQWSPAENNYLYDILELLLELGDLEYSENEAVGCLI